MRNHDLLNVPAIATAVTIPLGALVQLEVYIPEALPVIDNIPVLGPLVENYPSLSGLVAGATMAVSSLAWASRIIRNHSQPV